MPAQPAWEGEDDEMIGLWRTLGVLSVLGVVSCGSNSAVEQPGPSSSGGGGNSTGGANSSPDAGSGGLGGEPLGGAGGGEPCLPSPEVCDGADNDCDGDVDEDVPEDRLSCDTGQAGVCSLGNKQCQGGAFICVPITQPSSELCDGADNDCDGDVDEDDPSAGASCDTGQPGVCSAGSKQCLGGGIVCVQDTQPSSEACDGTDNDCDGVVDNDCVLFTAPAAYPVGNSPVALVTGDFNGDTYPDVAVANRLSNTISVLLNQTDGTFGPATSYGTSALPAKLVKADFNADGILDLATVDYAGYPDMATLSVLLGQGDGSFGQALITSGVTYGVGDLATLDANNDGNADLAISDIDLNIVTVVLGYGDGTFLTGYSNAYYVGTWPDALAVGDFDNDGNQDLAVTKNGSDLSLLFGSGYGAFLGPMDYPSGTVNAWDLLAHDLDGNGTLDLSAASGPNGNSNVASLSGLGSGSFGPPHNLSLFASDLAAGDLTGDGRADLVASHNADFVTILVNQGGLDFASVGPYPVGTYTLRVSVADLDLDGRLDIITLSLYGNAVGVLLNATP